MQPVDMCKLPPGMPVQSTEFCLLLPVSACVLLDNAGAAGLDARTATPLRTGLPSSEFKSASHRTPKCIDTMLSVTSFLKHLHQLGCMRISEMHQPALTALDPAHIRSTHAHICLLRYRDEPPRLVSWRITHYGVLEATLTVAGRTFRGELPPVQRGKRQAEASPNQPPPKRLGRPPVSLGTLFTVHDCLSTSRRLQLMLRGKRKAKASPNQPRPSVWAGPPVPLLTVQ